MSDLFPDGTKDARVPAVLNFSLMGLLVVLGALYAMGYGNVHVYVLGGMSAVLLIGVNWLLLNMPPEITVPQTAGSGESKHGGDAQKKKSQ